MIHLTRFSSLISCLALLLPLTASASPACPVKGLDNEVCPLVVNFFDDVAKQNPDFAKHWQNHHWVGQTGSNFSFQDLKLGITAHQTLMFGKRTSNLDLQKFIDDNLSRAAKSDPKFQQVIDSHNFFVMTVQAMHLSLQRGADHFNVSGAPRTSASGAPENVEFELTATETYKVPENDPFLNQAGIYFTDKYRYQHSVKIDSTKYQAGVTVAPVVVGVSNPIVPSPKSPKLPVSGQQKAVAGAGGGSGQKPHQTNMPNINAPITIHKQAGNRQRPGTPASVTPTTPPVSPVPKGSKVSGSGGQKQVYIVQVPSTTGSKPGASANKPNVNRPFTIQKQTGSRQRPGTPASVTPTTPPVSPVPKGSKISGSGGQKQVSIVQMPSTTGSKPGASVNKPNVNRPFTIQKKAGSRQRPGTPASQKVTSSMGQNAVKPNQLSIQKAPPGTNKSNVNAVLTTQKAGSQIDANERSYLIDDDNRVWSCKVSALGFRVTLTPSGDITRHGHVETAHIKSTQLAHIPANHARGSGCLISVHK